LTVGFCVNPAEGKHLYRILSFQVPRLFRNEQCVDSFSSRLKLLSSQLHNPLYEPFVLLILELNLLTPVFQADLAQRALSQVCFYTYYKCAPFPCRLQVDVGLSTAAALKKGTIGTGAQGGT
jgi:hypothetical protein